ncbi:MAG: hypothetical protein V2A72_05865 [Candidatus Omnitrophota bacterium]
MHKTCIWVMLALVALAGVYCAPVYAEDAACGMSTMADKPAAKDTVADPPYRMIKSNLETPAAVLDRLAKGENVPLEVLQRAKANVDEAVNLLNVLIPDKE